MASFALLAGAATASKTTPQVPEALGPAKAARFPVAVPLPPLARSGGTRPSPTNPSRRVPFYRVEMREFHRKLHHDLPPTRLWGYGGAFPGPTFETRSGDELLV